eukprot:175017_1
MRPHHCSEHLWSYSYYYYGREHHSALVIIHWRFWIHSADIIDELFAPRANSIGEYEHSFVDVAPQAHVFKVIIKLSYGQCCTPCDLWNRFGMARNKAKNNGRRGGGIGRRNYNVMDKSYG